ncbi:MAG: hypothetical protein P4L33_03720 [Capsulimonadaceae bacterium]|nr:hypothetical protein [Capsulimonadaceae bacterium]
MFSTIIGQPQAVEVLKGAIENQRLVGTYLFVGPAHVGKATTALALAQALNCVGEPDAPFDGCGTCYGCRAIADGTHPDVRSAAPSGPSRTLRIPQFWPREGVREHPADRAMLRDLHFAPVRGKKRVFIIEDADALNDDTANSLLKVLEEPPAYAIFVLTAPSTNSVLPTILSRSQAVRFRTVAAPDIEQALVSRHGVDQAHARFLAAFTQGQIGEAFRLASHPALLDARQAVLDAASDLTSGSPLIAAYKVADDLRKAADKLTAGRKDDAAESQRTALTHALDMVLLWYGDLLRIVVAKDSLAPINADRAEMLHRHAAGYAPATLARAVAILNDTRRYIERNASAQIATEALALQLLALPRRK